MEPPTSILPLALPVLSLRARISGSFKAPIDDDTLLEAQLLVLTFATGMEDATTYLDYRYFVSNQTGNTVLIAVGISGVGSSIIDVPSMAVSLSVFILGGWMMGQLGNTVGCRQRGWLITSSAIQTILTFIGSGLRYWQGNSGSDESIAHVVIALLAFSSVAQVSMVRSLKITDITTANATSAYVDTFIDTNLYKLHNRPRNRRLLFLLSLYVGSFAGAFTHKRFRSPLTLLISALSKILVTIALFFNKKS